MLQSIICNTCVVVTLIWQQCLLSAGNTDESEDWRRGS